MIGIKANESEMYNYSVRRRLTIDSNSHESRVSSDSDYCTRMPDPERKNAHNLELFFSNLNFGQVPDLSRAKDRQESACSTNNNDYIDDNQIEGDLSEFDWQYAAKQRAFTVGPIFGPIDADESNFYLKKVSSLFLFAYYFFCYDTVNPP